MSVIRIFVNCFPIKWLEMILCKSLEPPLRDFQVDRFFFQQSSGQMPAASQAQTEGIHTIVDF